VHTVAAAVPFSTITASKPCSHAESRNTEPQSDPIYYTLLSLSIGAHRCCCTFHSTITAANRAVMLRGAKKPYSWACFLTFLHPIFTVQDHILSTTGDALRERDALHEKKRCSYQCKCCFFTLAWMNEWRIILLSCNFLFLETKLVLTVWAITKILEKDVIV